MSNDSQLPIYTTLDWNKAPRQTGDPQTQPVNGAQVEDPLGRIWRDVDETLGHRTFKYLHLASDSDTPVVGSVLVFKDLIGNVVTTKIAAGSPRNYVACVTQDSVDPGHNFWGQTEGYHPGVLADGSTFAAGDQAVLSATDATATVTAAGTAPPYVHVGVVLAAKTGTPATAAMQLRIGY